MSLLERNWSKIKSRYGLTQDEFLLMFRSQNGACAICLERTYNLVIDHNHETGKVRGLLCDLCNKMIGMAREKPFILQKARIYILTQNGLENI